MANRIGKHRIIWCDLGAIVCASFACSVGSGEDQGIYDDEVVECVGCKKKVRLKYVCEIVAAPANGETR